MASIQLDKQSVAKLRQTQRELHDLLAEFDKAEECGVDCQAYRSIHSDALKATENLLKHYAT